MFDSDTYWEKRYADGGNSGKWSYGENATFKADFINKVLANNKRNTLIEVWCGDGNNLQLYKSKTYLGLDISPKAIEICKDLFPNDKYHIFEVYKGTEKYRADVVICFDVLMHVFPYSKREALIDHVVSMADEAAVFYTFPHPNNHAPHLNDYDFHNYIDKYCQIHWYHLSHPDETPPDSQSRFYVVVKNRWKE